MLTLACQKELFKVINKMYKNGYLRVRLGAKVDVKSKFEKFEKMSRKDQNDNAVIGGKGKSPSFGTRRDEADTKTKPIGKDQPTKEFEKLKLRETGVSDKQKTSSPRSSERTGGSDFAARRAEERKKNEEATNKMKSIEARMHERKQQKVTDARKRAQGRAAFKQQLESNAPKKDKSESSLQRAETNIDKLLKWVQNRINIYPGIKVEDWSASWADGKAFCALVQSLEPEEFPVDDVDHSGQDRKRNFELAFDFASKMGVPPLLDADDMSKIRTPDTRSVITYVHTIYKVMVHEKREKEKQAKEGKADEDEKDKDEKNEDEDEEDH